MPITGASSQPPCDDLVRAVSLPPQIVRAEADAGGAPLMVGHPAVFNQWTEIDSVFEGRFMEQLAPGSFTKTIKENAKGIRSLFQHGRDPQVGDKPLGPIEKLEEDADGLYAEVRMLDTSYNRDIIPGIEAGQYGQSFRFRVTRETIDEEPERSDYNPHGLPERTIKEVQMMEFGPVTFPAYAGTDVGMRSLTDEYVYDLSPEKIEQIRALIPESQTRETETPSDTDAGADTTLSLDDAGLTATSSTDNAGSAATSATPERRPLASDNHEGKETLMADKLTVDELQAERDNIHDRLKEIADEVGTNLFTEAQRAEVEVLKGQRDEFDARIAQAAAVRKLVAEDGPTEPIAGTFSAPRTQPDIYDLSTVRGVYDNPEQARREFHDRAEKAIEKTRFPDVGSRGSKEDMQERVSHLLDNADTEDSALARRILTTGHPLYEGAFWKSLQGRHLSSAESKVMDLAQRALGQATAGYAVPFALDPTVTLISSGVVNPLRAVSKIVTIAGETWKGVNSAGVVASYDAEAAEVSDDTPSLTQPTTTVLTARAFVPFSLEAEDWVGLRSELTSEFQDAKDVLEGTKFTLGTGSPDPQGIIPAATYLGTTAGSAVIALADIDTLTDALPPRYQANAVLMANRKFFSKVRQLDRTAGTNSAWAPMREGFPATLLGYPSYENSNIVGTITGSASLVAVVGDFSRFIIVDRIGMSVELIPHLFHTSNNLPSGQRGLFAYWRNTSVIRNVEAFRVLKVL